MKRKWLIYVGFFAVLLFVFYWFLFRMNDFSKSSLGVINEQVPDFAFTSQDGKKITQKDIDGKVYVAEYFFTTCTGICPRMNANMRRVFDEFSKEPGFVILSHTCMPETDSVPVLKAYEQRMLRASVVKAADGGFHIQEPADAASANTAVNTNWFFLTGNKSDLYKMARTGYIIDKNTPDSGVQIADQFIHTQFFSLVDKQRRVRGIYDGTKATEVDRLIADIKDLLREKSNKRNFLNNMGNTPN